MKCRLIALICFAACLICSAAEPSADTTELVSRLKGRVKIGTVNDSTIRNDAGEKILVLKFHTWQDERDKLDFCLRVTLELTDKEEKVYVGQVLRPQGDTDREYVGEDDWEFQIPLGKLNKPTLTACAVEYGILQQKTFIPVAAEFKHAESSDEIMQRSPDRVPVRCTFHRFWYRE